MILQLNPPLPITTPRGHALARALIDYGPEHNILWLCFLDETGECWTYSNEDIRARKNITMGRDPEAYDAAIKWGQGFEALKRTTIDDESDGDQ